jgi:hypothetical protein
MVEESGEAIRLDEHSTIVHAARATAFLVHDDENYGENDDEDEDDVRRRSSSSCEGFLVRHDADDRHRACIALFVALVAVGCCIAAGRRACRACCACRRARSLPKSSPSLPSLVAVGCCVAAGRRACRARSSPSSSLEATSPLSSPPVSFMVKTRQSWEDIIVRCAMSRLTLSFGQWFFPKNQHEFPVLR